MAYHMKTTVQIPHALFEEARKVAHRGKTTLKAFSCSRNTRIIGRRSVPCSKEAEFQARKSVQNPLVNEP